MVSGELDGFYQLVGYTIVKIWQDGSQLHYILDNGQHYMQYHDQDCCEQCWLHDVDGDLQDLVGSLITIADESSNQKDLEYGSETWTFYRLCTQKACVTMRWYGTSNGYYSESVDWKKVNG